MIFIIIALLSGFATSCKSRSTSQASNTLSAAKKSELPWYPQESNFRFCDGPQTFTEECVRFNPASKALDYANNITLAILSSLSYLQPYIKEHTTDITDDKYSGFDYAQKINIESVRYFSTASNLNDTTGYIFEGRDFVIISFAGTKSVENVLTDIKYKPLTFPNHLKFHGGFAIALLGETEIWQKSIKGPVGQWSTTRSQLIKEIAKTLLPNRHKKIWLTGHSMGGALALIAGHVLNKNEIPVQGIYTYGAPRVASRYTADYYHAMVTNNVFQFRHKTDPVPTWLDGEYKHIGQIMHLHKPIYWYEQNFDKLTLERDKAIKNKERSRNDPLYAAWGDTFKDHYRSNYIKFASELYHRYLFVNY